MKNLFVRFVREENGQDLIEYAASGGAHLRGHRGHGLLSIGGKALFTGLDTRSPLVVGCPARSGAQLPSRRVSFARGVHIT